MLINPRNKEIRVNLPGESKEAMLNYVDEDSGENGIVQITMKDAVVNLKPFTVAILQLKH